MFLHVSSIPRKRHHRNTTKTWARPTTSPNTVKIYGRTAQEPPRRQHWEAAKASAGRQTQWTHTITTDTIRTDITDSRKDLHVFSQKMFPAYFVIITFSHHHHHNTLYTNIRQCHRRHRQHHHYHHFHHYHHQHQHRHQHQHQHHHQHQNHHNHHHHHHHHHHRHRHHHHHQQYRTRRWRKFQE